MKIRQLEIQVETLQTKNEFLEKQNEDKRNDFEKRIANMTRDHLQTLQEKDKKYLEEKRARDELQAENSTLRTEISKLKGDINSLEIQQSKISEEAHLKYVE